MRVEVFLGLYSGPTILFKTARRLKAQVTGQNLDHLPQVWRSPVEHAFHAVRCIKTLTKQLLIEPTPAAKCS